MRFPLAALAATFWLLLSTACLADELRGQVVDAQTGEPVSMVDVRLLGPDGTRLKFGLGDGAGRFHLTDIPEQTVSIVLKRLGYEDLGPQDIQLSDTGDTELRFEMYPLPLIMDAMVVTASRMPETVMDSPNLATTVQSRAIETRQSVTALDAIQGEQGVGYTRKGIFDSTWRIRGGGGTVINTSNLVLQDWRPTRTSGFTYNIPYWVPATMADIDHIEVIRGDTGGMYGPDSGSAVLHIFTRSPFEHQGTSLSAGVGERSYREAWIRHSGMVSSKLGFQLSSRYLAADDWPVEWQPAAGENPEVKLTNYQAAMEWRPSEETRVHLVGGGTSTRDILQQFPSTYARLEDVGSRFLQARLHRRRMMVNLVYNANVTGEGSLLPYNLPIAENSRFYSLQAHDGRDVEAGGVLNRITYGIDLRTTNIRTDGTLTGRYEDKDTVSQYGAFFGSTAVLSDRLNVFGSIRADYHDRLDDSVALPFRVGAAFKPSSRHAIRVNVGQSKAEGGVAFLFEDLPFGFVPVFPGYPIRSIGTPSSGWNFARDANGDLQMRSRLVAGGLAAYKPADATLAWGALQGRYPELAGIPAPDANAVGSRLGRWNPDSRQFDAVDPASIDNISQAQRATFDNLELSYTGWLNDHLSINAGAWATRTRGGTERLLITPSVFFDQSELESYLSTYLPQQADSLAAVMAGAPVGTVAPQEIGASDELIWAVRPRTQTVTSGGLSVGAKYRLMTGWSIGLNYEWNDMEKVNGEKPNLVGNRGFARLAYDPVRPGMSGSVELRAQESYLTEIQYWSGPVDGFVETNMNLAYELPTATRIIFFVNATNVFDQKHIEVFGGKRIGRLVTARVQVDF